MLDTNPCYCPYCGEPIELVIDPIALAVAGTEHMEYIEDCSVCCRPINVALSYSHGDETEGLGHIQVTLSTENECPY